MAIKWHAGAGEHEVRAELSSGNLLIESILTFPLQWGDRSPDVAIQALLYSRKRAQLSIARDQGNSNRGINVPPVVTGRNHLFGK